MDISVLIPNHNDLRIYNMINSIDYIDNENHHVELVIVLNKPTKELMHLISKIKIDFKDKFQIKIVEINYCNLGIAYNEGIKNAKYNNILFIDTDLICDTDAIKTVINDFNKTNAKIVKAKVVYDNMKR